MCKESDAQFDVCIVGRVVCIVGRVVLDRRIRGRTHLPHSHDGDQAPWNPSKPNQTVRSLGFPATWWARWFLCLGSLEQRKNFGTKRGSPHDQFMGVPSRVRFWWNLESMSISE